MVSPRVLLQKVDEWVATGSEPPTTKRWKGVDLDPAKFANPFDDEPF